MTDEQFGVFQRRLQTDALQKSEVAHVASHIVKHSLFAQYPDMNDIALPFDDKVVGTEVNRFVHLSFLSNRPFVNSLSSIRDIKKSGTIVEAITGYLISAPKDSRDAAGFERWLREQKKGDFGFDDAKGGSLIAIRGAKLVKLDVTNWVEADAIDNKQLKALLDGPTAGQAVSLKKHYQQDDNAPICYVAVSTKSGQLAVVSAEYFSDPTSIMVRTRARSALPNPITEDDVKETDGLAQGEPIGDASDGVQLRIHSPEVSQDREQWKVALKTDIRASEERVLPNYGAPIDAYLIQWDGTWYRYTGSANLAASMKPSKATRRESMHTVISSAGWVDESTGKPMPSLSVGKHKLRIALPLPAASGDKAEDPPRAVSNEIEVEIADHTIRIKGQQDQTATVDLKDESKTMSELIISKNRGGQVSPGGVSYVLDDELIMLDKLQSRLEEKLKATPNLKLSISAEVEIQYQAVMVAMQLANAAGIDNVSFVALGDDAAELERAARIKAQQKQSRAIDQLPPLSDLGIIMIADSKAVVGNCESHSPFANANLRTGDQIVSVDGRKVDSIESLKKALSLARPKRSIEFVIITKFVWRMRPRNKR